MRAATIYRQDSQMKRVICISLCACFLVLGVCGGTVGVIMVLTKQESSPSQTNTKNTPVRIFSMNKVSMPIIPLPVPAPSQPPSMPL